MPGWRMARISMSAAMRRTWRRTFMPRSYPSSGNKAGSRPTRPKITCVICSITAGINAMSIDTVPRVDRTRDRSQPLANLGPDETLQAESNHLRGGIAEGLLDEITSGLSYRDQKLLKFHGMYQQDDRDLRDERRRQKLE